LFSGPHSNDEIKNLTADKAGFMLAFSGSFFTNGLVSSLNELPMFEKDANPVYPLTHELGIRVAGVFGRMIKEKDSAYVFKNDLLKNYIIELTHLALKANPR
jgi:AraC family transcriptional regulator, transcriptional activator of pobA